MLIFIAVLVLTGFIIEVAEAIVYADGFAQIPAYLLFIMSFLTAAHVISGVCFAALSTFHIIKNWNALKNHLKTKNGKALALLWLLIVAFLALLVAFIKES
jgi:hypothetical protein